MDRLIEENSSAGLLSRTLAEHVCVRCGQQVSHLFRPDDDQCQLCPETHAAHAGLPQGAIGWLHCIRREHDDTTTLTFLWCYECAVMAVEEHSCIEFIRALFAAVPADVRRQEVVTASVRRRYQN
jgi:hypothetical protein